jgi:hypothetical protein
MIFESGGSSKKLQELSLSLISKGNIKSIMVLACDANEWGPEALDPILKTIPVPVFGGIFPKIIYGKQVFDKGTIVVGMPVHSEIVVVKELSNQAADYIQSLESTSEAWMRQGNGQNETIIVFVDGLSKRIGSLVEAMFFAFGLERNFIGGGAGSLSFKQMPCLITPNGLIMDAGLIVRLPLYSSVGVDHGWQAISDSMKVTTAERNTINTLDWIPAFDVYRKLVEVHSGKALAEDNFFNLAKCYPFGINKLGGELVVRDPLWIDGNKGLVCVGEVPTGSFVYLLNGSPETLINAASNARSLALEYAQEAISDDSATLFIDCISRALFLEGRIGEELEAVAGSGELFGAMTLGEIANNGRDYLEFYNKTAVVALLGKKTDE